MSKPSEDHQKVWYFLRAVTRSCTKIVEKTKLVEVESGKDPQGSVSQNTLRFAREMVTAYRTLMSEGNVKPALDFAIKNGIGHGGYCPKGRRSENGRISDKYNLTETSSSDYPMRTAMNVQHSDGTLIITRGHPEGGARKTVSLCIERGKPKFIVDIQHRLKPAEFADWIRQNNIRTLNVAGPRKSKQSGIGKETKNILTKLFSAL